jgi:hypothetical protein
LNWNIDADDRRLLDHELSNHCAADLFPHCNAKPDALGINRPEW